MSEEWYSYNKNGTKTKHTSKLHSVSELFVDNLSEGEITVPRLASCVHHDPDTGDRDDFEWYKGKLHNYNYIRMSYRP